MKNSLNLTTSIDQLPLIGPNTALKLTKLNIYTVKDLLFHVPFRYKDTSKTITITQFLEEKEGMIVAKCENISSTRIKRFFITKAKVSDETGSVNITWFNQPYIQKQFKVGQTYLIEGKLSEKKGFKSIISPQFEIWEDPNAQDENSDLNSEIISEITKENLDKIPSTITVSTQSKIQKNSKPHNIHLGRIVPFYPATEGLSSKFIRSRIFQLKTNIDELISDPLFINPEAKDYLTKYEIISLNEAIKQLHFPETIESISFARKRLAFDELLKLAYNLEQKKLEFKGSKAFALSLPNQLNIKFMNLMKFSLTEDQQEAINSIQHDISKNIPMKRLLNGDVGSGKTIVAMHSCYTAICNGYSALVMAPTTILAQQHFESFKNLFDKLGIRIVLCTSNSKNSVENNTASETPTIIIGTHALLFDKDLPKKIALVVVDEQHRFGVKQRAALADLQSEQNIRPHYLSMTATPIPRTLTTVLYGDMEVSFIKSMPKNRVPIKSYYVPETKRDNCFKWVNQHILDSEYQNQAFVIFPLIEESEKVQAKAAITEFEKLQKTYFKDLKVGLLHGQLKPEEKDEILMKFRNKEFNVLVATSVVEVGIDIPDATVMIIENAERFGLAQLHQFRGRVGRGDKQSYCYVMYGGEKSEEENLTSEVNYLPRFEELQLESKSDINKKSNLNKKANPAIERLKYFAEHNSGFDVAQYDLQHRGPGEVYGDIQSGVPNLKIANILDLELLEKARNLAKELIRLKGVSETEKILSELFS